MFRWVKVVQQKIFLKTNLNLYIYTTAVDRKQFSNDQMFIFQRRREKKKLLNGEYTFGYLFNRQPTNGLCFRVIKGKGEKKEGGIIKKYTWESKNGHLNGKGVAYSCNFSVEKECRFFLGLSTSGPPPRPYC